MMEIKYRTQLGQLLESLNLTGPAAEIGVAEGRNAEVLIAQPAITKLYMIDTWTHLEQLGDGGHPQKWHEGNYIEAQERTLPYQEKAVFMKGFSRDGIAQIPDDSLILAYVDGDHSYNGCMADLKAIWPKIKAGGVLACHDFLNLFYGVNRAVNEFLSERGLVNNLHLTEEDGDRAMVSCWVIKK